MPKGTTKTDFKGVSFKKYSKGKYMQSSKGVGGEQYLQRAVWKAAHGNIPKGYEVHHKDHNTLNNRLSNLALVKSGEHQAMHNKLEAKAKAKAKTKARPKAKIAKTKVKTKVKTKARAKTKTKARTKTKAKAKT